MSEHDTHHEHGGGHELDVMPNRRLFNLLTSLSALTLIACIGLVAFFYRQAETLFVERAKEGSFLLRQYQEEMREVAEGYGPTGDGSHFFVPHEKAKELVLSDPSRFRAAPPPPGWIHPDDLQGGGNAAAQVPAPAGTEPSGGPTDGAGAADDQGTGADGDTAQPVDEGGEGAAEAPKAHEGAVPAKEGESGAGEDAPRGASAKPPTPAPADRGTGESKPSPRDSNPGKPGDTDPGKPGDRP
ncbi:MAG: hypothetical protein D6705_07105 [Deltaproteobacteria bacterium]|nr:MAG: hypothetical protein D6705_07105 [Deltaproteobacteria bacterium]